MEKIEHIIILRENCKRKANDSISIVLSKLIRSELMATDFEVQHLDIKSISEKHFTIKYEKIIHLSQIHWSDFFLTDKNTKKLLYS